MRKLNIPLALFILCIVSSGANAAVVDTSDDFDTSGETYSSWVSVGATTTTIEYDPISVEDYDDGDVGAKLAYTVGMTLTGDGVKDDGGLKLNSQNNVQGDEAIGLTIAGALVLGEELRFTGSVYNDNSSYSIFKAQLWNLTDSTLLAESAGQLVRNDAHNTYVPLDFDVTYTAVAGDVGDTLQIRFVEDNNNTARDIFVDNFALDSSLSPSSPVTGIGDDPFWFSFYSTIGEDSAYAVAHGATGIGPYYGGLAGQVDPLAEAQALGVNFSYKVVLPSMAGFTPGNSDTFDWPSDATLIAEATAIVDAMKTNLNIVMWDLVPEELRYWKPNELNFLEVVADAIRAADPLDRPVMMYEPNHRVAAHLAQTVPYQDICGKGTYISTTSEFRHNRIWARWSMEQELEAIAAANTNAVPWILLWMAADALDGEEHLIHDWCRHDAYMGLIMGGKGISIWSGWRPRSSWVNDFQTYFDGYLSVAADLNLQRNFAPVFLYGAEVAGVSHSVTGGPASLELVYPAGTTNHYPPVTYTLREFLGQHYLFMVNSATQAVSITFNGVPDAERTDLFEDTVYPASGGSFSLSLEAYEVAGFRFDGYDAWRDDNFTAQQILDGDADEAADPDSDGRTNRAEFNDGTDPNDGDDYFQARLAFSNDWKNVSFNTSSNRFYTVDMITNLNAGSWQPMLGNEPGTGADLSVIDTNDFPETFYRTRAVRP